VFDSDPPLDYIGEPYNALSSHVILVIDSGQETDSPLASALRSSDPEQSRYTQDVLYLAADDPTVPVLDTLRDWLQMENPDVAASHYEEMLRLRAVVIDWDRVAQARECCREVRLAYPCLALFVVAKGDSGDVQRYFGEARLGDCPVTYGGENRYELAAGSIADDLDRAIDWRYDTPYWDSLLKYAAHPVISFHALPLGQSRSLSQSLTDFSTFYGDRLFAAETSLTTTPLDSLLNPRTTIERAQAKAAYAFGAESGLQKGSKAYGTRFVTNGTSTANAVVIGAFVKPGDRVLMERTCHISHYHALAYAKAIPQMLEPFVNAWGCIGPVPLDALRQALQRMLTEHGDLPAAIILTNPTFDGLFYRPVALVDAVADVLKAHWRDHRATGGFMQLLRKIAPQSSAAGDTVSPDITEGEFLRLAFQRMVFLFDEAWSARAYFHPRLIEYTAMRSAWDLSRRDDMDYTDCLRFYATQSTHKSLSALRQGSMIHFRDPLMEAPETRQVFEQSFRAHCTTSPSASIIASLDVARRQAQLEGALLIERCMRLAEDFRREFPKADSTGGENSIYVLDEQLMMKSGDGGRPDLSPEECFLDPTHITLAWDSEFTGNEMRRALLRNSIQVNKYEHSSILAIFNIGIDRASVDAFRTALVAMGRRLEDSGSVPRRKVPDLLPPFSGICETGDMGYWMKNECNLPCSFYDVEDLLTTLQDEADHRYIAASFVTPYPPGYPVLVPGQPVGREELEFLLAVPIHEIFGTQRQGDRMSIMLYRIDSGGRQQSALDGDDRSC
jgi:arginine decarboxylase